MEFSLTDDEKQIILKTAREAITSKLTGKKARNFDATPSLKEKCGAFVTLHKHDRLRGCIGYVSALNPLIETIKETAEASAFNDPRFPSVKKEELSHIHIEVSVLSPLTRIHNLEKIQVGVHGIMMKQGFNSGLLLPQVATENNWDRETFLIHTCHKAGLPGDCWKKKNTEIEIFSAIIFDESMFPDIIDIYE